METATCEVIPIKNQIIFEFLDIARKGYFQEVTETGLLIMENSSKQVDYCRWGRVLGIGEEVSEFNPGDLVLIEQLQWTQMFKITDTQYWITTDEKILATWDDPDSLPNC